MPFSYKDLWGDVHPLEEGAIKIIKTYEPSEGYWVAFSGGKDSIVILDLVRRANVKYEAHFAMTTVDPPEVYKFIRENYPDVIWDKPKISMYKLIEKKLMLPTRMKRFCCHNLKEMGGTGRVIIVGVRSEESPSRSKQPVFGVSTRTKNKWFLRPILRWKTNDVWEYIKRYNLSYPCLYDEGYTRIGCIMCPLQKLSGKLMDIERYPKHYRAYYNTIKKCMDKRNKKGNNPLLKWGDTPDKIMEKWIYG